MKNNEAIADAPGTTRFERPGCVGRQIGQAAMSSPNHRKIDLDLM